MFATDGQPVERAGAAREEQVLAGTAGLRSLKM